MISIQLLWVFGCGCGAGIVVAIIVWFLMGIAYGWGRESREEDDE